MTTTPEDADALFGLASSPPPAAPAAASRPAPSPPPAGGFAGSLGASVLDNRREQRVKVSWPGRIQLPDGRVIELRVRDISDSGIGLLAEETIPAATVLLFAMGVPGLEVPHRVTPVSGTIRTTYSVVQGPDICCGAEWVDLGAAGRDLIGQWLRRLRR